MNRHMTHAVSDPMAAPNGATFTVKFGTGSTYWRTVAPNSFKFHGRGEIEVGPDIVVIRGKRHRLFRPGVPEEHAFRSEDIVDVRADGRIVRFDLVAANRKTLQTVGFVANDDDEAARIVACLPGRQTQAFAQDFAERKTFRERMAAVSPRAPVTPILVAINVLVFALMAIGGAGVLTPDGEVAIRWGSNYGPNTIDGQWWRLLTSMFIHFGIIHLTLNMLALYQTGQVVERMFGSVRFLLLYGFAGLCGSMLSIAWHPDINSAGASGAIFGVFGAQLAFVLNKNNGVPASIMNEQRNSMLAFIAFNLFYGFSHAGIDNGAHIGGLLGGAVAGFALARPVDPIRRQSPETGRLMAAFAVGAILLGAAGLFLHGGSENAAQERRFKLALRDFYSMEKQVLADANSLIGKANAKTITDTDFADAMSLNIVPRWEEMDRKLLEAHLEPASKQFALQQAMSKYARDRASSGKLLAQAVRASDAQLMARADEQSKVVKADIDAIRALMHR
jgi:rhomboid protease GluP